MDLKANKAESTPGSKEDFMLKKKLFDKSPQTMESLLDERRDLYQRLQLSRDELDSYIRYMHKMCDEKKDQSDELSTLKTNNETLTRKCKRLENQNKLLVKESSDLMTMLADFGPKELYNYTRTNPNTEEAITNKLKESVQVIFNENGKLHQEQELLKNELREVTVELNQSHKKVNELTKTIKQYEEDQELSENQSLQQQYDELMREHSKCSSPRSQSKHLLNSTVIDTNDGSRPIHESIEQYYSIDSETPPSFHTIQGDNSSLLTSSYFKNSFNVDIFEEFPYKLRSYDVYSDSEGIPLDEKTLYKSALQNSSLSYGTGREQQSRNNSTTDSNNLTTNTLSINSPNTTMTPTKSTNEKKVKLGELLRKTSTIDQTDILVVGVSIRELHKTVRSLFQLLETLSEDSENSPPVNVNQLEDVFNMDDINCPRMAFEYLSGSIDVIKYELMQVSELLTKMSSEFTDARDENTMLAKEITALKYALTCRIELKNSRTTPQPIVHNCDCDEKTAQFNEQRTHFEQTICELNEKIEELNEDRTNLFSLITQITSDSGTE